MDIRAFDHAMQTVSQEGTNEHCWTVVPGTKGITLSFDQWQKMTSLSGLYSIEHLKALVGVPFLHQKKKNATETLSKRRKVDLKLEIPKTIHETEEETNKEEVPGSTIPDSAKGQVI